jgi:hypothetical protein
MKRIQRKRTKGWRLPDNAVCITRGTKWGNPFKISDKVTRDVSISIFEKCILNPTIALDLFGFKIYEHFKWISEHIHELKDKDLACFCKEGDPCHGDVLINFIQEKYGTE